ncbi:hypothetical protein [Frankia sp. R82]|uniref:hypothetical protein n=1 Tax=Frankia sp. R82 TaxID=2950553 RepID=UPI00204454E8|nr:hypothetical protein [Frankia sp. R82]MCM3883468.1 hypothetical protein [Frankia sp. R82]
MRDTQPDLGPEAQLPRPAGLPGSVRGARIRTGRIVAGIALVGMAALASGCNSGGSDGVDGSAPSPSASTQLGLPTALPTSLASRLPTALPSSVGASIPGVGRLDAVTGAGALHGTNVPADFPVPPNAKAKVGTSAGATSTVALTGVPTEEMVTFYRRALPAAGYTITSDVGVGGVAHSISFTGHGVKGGLGSVGVGGSGGLAIVFAKA